MPFGSYYHPSDDGGSSMMTSGPSGNLPVQKNPTFLKPQVTEPSHCNFPSIFPFCVLQRHEITSPQAIGTVQLSLKPTEKEEITKRGGGS